LLARAGKHALILHYEYDFYLICAGLHYCHYNTAYRSYEQYIIVEIFITGQRNEAEWNVLDLKMYGRDEKCILDFGRNT
jgi:hypothetical protein